MDLKSFIENHWAALIVSAIILAPIIWKLSKLVDKTRVTDGGGGRRGDDEGKPDPVEGKDAEVLPYHFPESVDNFYQHYAQRTAQAKQEIWVTSDGYNWRRGASRRYGKIMKDARCKAMANGVTIWWFQVTDTMHLNWISQIWDMKATFRDRFRVYINPTLSVPNVCVIDPGRDDCVSESMEHRTGDFGQGSEAVSGVFVEGDLDRAARTKAIVQDAIQNAGSRELARREDFLDLETRLMAERLERLRQWYQTDGARGDVAHSGVFDEQVIDQFIRTLIKNTGT